MSYAAAWFGPPVANSETRMNKGHVAYMRGRYPGTPSSNAVALERLSKFMASKVTPVVPIQEATLELLPNGAPPYVRYFYHRGFQ
jgi:hypothetical protein